MAFHSHPQIKFSGAKADSLITVDLRTVPVGVYANIGVGLLEPGNVSALPIIGPIEVEGMAISPQQLHLSTAAEPWLVVSVHWISNPGDEPAA